VPSMIVAFFNMVIVMSSPFVQRVWNEKSIA
jgi:hypothetical protein